MDIFARAIHSLLSLYMILILVRWFGPYLSLDLERTRWRWIARLTDPFIDRLRAMLPNLGPVDFGPLAAFFLVWFVRVFSVAVLLNMARSSTLPLQ